MIGAIGLFDGKIGTSGLGGAGAPSPAVGGGEAASSFADLLAAAANNTVDRLSQAESISVQALQGKADTRDVVDAVMSAEQSLHAAIAIRDKIVSAYLDISRMAI